MWEKLLSLLNVIICSANKSLHISPGQAAPAFPALPNANQQQLEEPGEEFGGDAHHTERSLIAAQGRTRGRRGGAAPAVRGKVPRCAPSPGERLGQRERLGTQRRRKERLFPDGNRHPRALVKGPFSCSRALLLPPGPGMLPVQ